MRRGQERVVHLLLIIREEEVIIQVLAIHTIIHMVLLLRHHPHILDIPIIHIMHPMGHQGRHILQDHTIRLVTLLIRHHHLHIIQ